MMRVSLLLVVWGVVLVPRFAEARVWGQETTPIAVPVFPVPSECSVAPRAVNDVIGLLATPTAGTPESQAVPTAVANVLATAQAGAAAFTPPAGPALDPLQVEGLDGTVRQFYACYNAGDLLAMLALVSDDALRRFPEGSNGFRMVDSAFIQGAGPRRPEDQIGYTVVRDARILPDGRYGAFVMTIIGSGQGSNSVDVYWIFTRQDGGRYLIDGVVFGVGGDPFSLDIPGR